MLSMSTDEQNSKVVLIIIIVWTLQHGVPQYGDIVRYFLTPHVKNPEHSRQETRPLLVNNDCLAQE